MRLIDGHAHLEDAPNLDSEISHAKTNGLVAVIAVGSDEKSNDAVLKISTRYADFVLPAMGLHPWNIRDNVDDMIKSIETNIKKCVAIGEVGLDFKYQTPRELQIEAFKRVLGLATRYDKPVIIHSRWAWKEAFEMVRDASAKRTVFHWYSGPIDILREILTLGCYVSATPAAEYSEPHKLALKEVPLDRLLLETDSPVKYRGTASTPSDVLKTLKAVAQLKGIDEREVAETTTKNAIELFNLKL
ncbi:MAG: TatD family hydrolase [Methanobacteriota archaeon]